MNTGQLNPFYFILNMQCKGPLRQYIRYMTKLNIAYIQFCDVPVHLRMYDISGDDIK
jgi:hypothetical protein